MVQALSEREAVRDSPRAAVVRELNAKLEPISTYVNKTQGQSRGVSLTTGLLFSALTLILATFAALGWMK